MLKHGHPNWEWHEQASVYLAEIDGGPEGGVDGVAEAAGIAVASAAASGM